LVVLGKASPLESPLQEAVVAGQETVDNLATSKLEIKKIARGKSKMNLELAGDSIAETPVLRPRSGEVGCGHGY
jgi:hypothetical protein